MPLITGGGYKEQPVLFLCAILMANSKSSASGHLGGRYRPTDGARHPILRDCDAQRLRDCEREQQTCSRAWPQPQRTETGATSWHYALLSAHTH